MPRDGWSVVENSLGLVVDSWAKSSKFGTKIAFVATSFHFF